MVRGRAPRSGSQRRITRLDSAFANLPNLRHELKNHRSRLRRDFLPPALVTFVVATVITAFTLNITSWMTPLASNPSFIDWWNTDNIVLTFQNTTLTTILAGVCFIYITDMRDWRRCWKYLYYPLCVIIATAFLIWSSLGGSPIWVLGLSIAAAVIASITVRNRLFKGTPKKYLAYGECLAYSLLAVIMIVAWLIWFTNGGDRYIQESDDWQDGVVIKTVSPVVQAGAYLVVAWFAWIRSRWHSKRQEQENTFDLGPEFNTAIIILVSLLGLIYLAVVIGVGDKEVSQFILNICVLLLGSISIYVLNWIGIKKLKKAAEESEQIATIIGIFSSDWFKAIMLIALGWILPLLMLVEFLHQVVRYRLKSLGLLYQNYEAEDDDEEWDNPNGRWVTSEMGRWLDFFFSWNISSILTKTIWLGIVVFIFMQAVSKGMSVFLSWFNEFLRPYSIAFTMALLFVVEMALFLFPPVAGIVLYLTAALVLIPKFVDRPGPPHDPMHKFILGITASALFCWVLKLIAVGVEQKVFGGAFKNDIHVKKFIGIHTEFMKSIHYILSGPGMWPAKVSILVGGPDWPTSVLTGILDLPMLPMLAGTIPVIFIIAPTCASSGFLLCPAQVFGEEGWPGCAVVDRSLLIAAAVIQQTTTFVMLYHIGVLLDHMKGQGEIAEDWMKDPQEDEILALVALDSKRDEFYKEQTQMKKMPCYVKVALMIGALSSILIFAIQFLGSPMKGVELNQTLCEQFKDCNPIHVVNPLGWVQVGAFCVSFSCIKIFGRWVDANMPVFALEEAQLEVDAEMSERIERKATLKADRRATVAARQQALDHMRASQSHRAHDEVSEVEMREMTVR